MANPRRRRQAKIQRLAQVRERTAPAAAPAAVVVAPPKDPTPVAAPKTVIPSAPRTGRTTTRTRKSTATSKTTKK